MKKNIFVFFGGPGSGKSTQLALFKKYLEQKEIEVVSFGYGKYTRQKERDDDKFFTLINKGVNEGEYAPSCIFSAALLSFFHKNFETKSIFLLDGPFRKINEIEDFLQLFQLLEFECLDVFLFDLSIDVAKNRIVNRKEIRNDSSLEIIENRLKVYNEQSKESIKFFEKNSFINTVYIDAEQSINEISQKVIEFYDNKK